MEIQSVEPYKFYSNQSVQLLKRALEGLQKQHEQQQKAAAIGRASVFEVANSADGDDDGGGASAIHREHSGYDHFEDGHYSSEDEMISDDDEKKKNDHDDHQQQNNNNKNNNSSNSNKQPKKKKKQKTTEEYLKQMGTPPSETLITEIQQDTNTALALSIPNVLFPSVEHEDFLTGRSSGRHVDAHFYQSRAEMAKNQDHLEPILSLYNLAYSLSSYNSHDNNKNNKDNDNTSKQQNIFIILLHSGRFAAAIFHQGQCIKHTTSTRYTVRKGQGGSQSTMDNAKGKAKSVGSQLRRAGELQLRNDVYTTLMNWKEDIDNCALILLSMSKMLQKGFWEDVDKVFQKSSSSSSSSGGGGVRRNKNWNGFQKGSDQVKSIPLDVGKPCFESCCAVYELLLTCSKLTVNLSVSQHEEEQQQERYESNNVRTTAVEESPYSIEEDHTMLCEKLETTIVEEYIGEPLTPLHIAAKDGNVDELTSLIAESNGNHHNDIDSTAGPKLMTPLHYAAESSSTKMNCNNNLVVVDHATAAKCIQILLVQGHANPCMLDSHNRPPVYLTTNDTVRNAFRMARAELGEEMWNWTDGAKVGPPLTTDDLKQKREKAAEKKRRQRQRQKERKAIEKQQKAEEEQRAKEEEEKKEQEENARRVRAGLKPKAAGSKGRLMCDFCQKDCTGKRKSQLFTRLEFVYCSTDCMRKHQRELMATAAMARMGV